MKTHGPYLRGRRRAFALISVLTLVIAVLLMLGATGLLVTKNLGAGNHAEIAQQAKYSAAAGLRYALAELSENPDWEPGGGVLVGTLSHVDTTLGYEVEIKNNYGNLTDLVDGDITVPPMQVYMHAYGTRNGVRVAGNYGIAEKIAVKPDVVFKYALYETRSGCNPKETFVRSYSSDPYQAADYMWGSGTPHNDAAIRANASFGFDPTPPAWVDGPVILPSAAVFGGGSTDFTGGLVFDPVTPLRLKFRVPVRPTDLRAATPAVPVLGPTPLAPGRYGSLIVPAGSTLILRDGIYVFDTLEVVGAASPGGAKGSIQLAPFPPAPAPPATPPACVVYIRQRFDLGNEAEVNTLPLNATRPRNFQLYTTDEGVSGPESSNFGPNCTPVLLGGDSVFTGTIAGHGAVVVMATDSMVRGGMTVGRQVWGSRAKIEYDRTLALQKLDGDSEWVLTGEGDE